MDYTVRLMDKKKFSEDQRKAIEDRYSRALLQHFGGPQEVAAAHKAWVNAKTRQDEAPEEVSIGEKQSIFHWENAEAAARLLAFEGYSGALEDLYIEVKAHHLQAAS